MRSTRIPARLLALAAVLLVLVGCGTATPFAVETRTPGETAREPTLKQKMMMQRRMQRA